MEISVEKLGELQPEDCFVPVVVNYLPSPSDSISWVLIDKEEPKSE